MADIILTTELLSDAQAHRVYLREHWDDEWTEVEFLECTYVTWQANPSVSTAGLRWDYGVLMRQGETAFGLVDALEKLNHWIKIEIDQVGEEADPLKWYGHIEEDVRNLDGCETDAPGGDPDARVPSGEQLLIAYGLEALLDRQKIMRCWWQDDTGTERELGRGITFNREDQIENLGNRSTAKGLRDTYLFSGNLYSGAAKWSTRDILDYLLAYHGPIDFLGNDAIQIKLHKMDSGVVPDFDEPVVTLHGRTLKELLDELFDRRRGLGYVVELEEGGGNLGNDAVLIRPFTFLEVPIVLPSGNWLSQNYHQNTLDFDRATDVDTASIKTTGSQIYEQVVAVGDRVLCCGSAAPLDDTLVGHWRNDDKTEYNLGASTAGDPPGTDYPPVDEVYKRQQRNADARAAEHLKRVFRYFGLPDDWDGKVGNGEGGDKNYLFPYTELGVDPNTQSAFYLPDLRFHHQLPLTDLATTPNNQKFTYRPTFVVLKLHDKALEDDPYDRYAQVELLSAAADVELTGDDAGRDWCCSVQVQDDGPGVILNVCGEQQHVIAGGQFVPLPDAGDMEASAFDWQDNLIVTFAMRADWHLEAIWPDLIIDPVDVVRQLRIDARNLAQGHWVAAGTVVDLKDGKLQRQATGAWKRDDRPLLEDLARIAFEWYGTARQALTLVVERVWGELHVGDLISTIGADETEEDIRTVVTSLRIDLSQSGQEGHRTTIETQWAELDVLSLV